jgi:flagellar basal-body rod protein FlgG
MLTGLARQEVWSNNLANAQTPGFRQDEVILRSFPEELLFRYEQGAASNVPVGRLGMGADAAGMTTSDLPGRIVETGSALDLALEGPGFLAVRTAGGIRYTRHGRLNVDQDGFLCSGPGQRLLGPDGQAVAVPLDAGLEISLEGSIEAGGQVVGQLGLWRFADAAALRKEGSNLFLGQGAFLDVGETRLRQRSVELPNTDPVLAVTEMLSILRAYEASQRALQAQDETLGKAVNEVGRV